MEAMPMSAFGTMEADPAKAGEMHGLVCQAISAGYRHIDTAEAYASLPHTLRAITECLPGLNGQRQSFWITSKLRGLPAGPYEAVEARVRKMLEGSEVVYFDLVLCHWPGPPDADTFDGCEEATEVAAKWFRGHIGSAWKNMLRLRSSGLARRVGVSNFYSGHLTTLRSMYPEEPPFANQLFIDATHHENAVLSVMRRWGVAPFAYRPLAYHAVWALAGDMGDGLYRQLAARARELGASSVQDLVLRWLHGRGVGTVCQSSNPQHLEMNLAAAAHPDKSVTLLAVNTAEDCAGLAIDDGNEMVAMCGGQDDFALSFKAASSHCGSSGDTHVEFDLSPNLGSSPPHPSTGW